MRQRTTLWFGFVAGGGFKPAWNEKNKCWYYPAFDTHDQVSDFWHQQDDRAWAVGEVVIIPPATDTDRDPESPCDHWQKYEDGDIRGDCPGDGHFRCPECREWEGTQDE